MKNVLVVVVLFLLSNCSAGQDSPFNDIQEISINSKYRHPLARLKVTQTGHMINRYRLGGQVEQVIDENNARVRIFQYQPASGGYAIMSSELVVWVEMPTDGLADNDTVYFDQAKYILVKMKPKSYGSLGGKRTIQCLKSIAFKNVKQFRQAWAKNNANAVELKTKKGDSFYAVLKKVKGSTIIYGSALIANETIKLSKLDDKSRQVIREWKTRQK